MNKTRKKGKRREQKNRTLRRIYCTMYVFNQEQQQQHQQQQQQQKPKRNVKLNKYNL